MATTVKSDADVSLAESASFLIRRSEEIRVVDAASEKLALDLLGTVRKEVKRLDKERKDRLAPFKFETDRINESYRALIDPLKEADDRLSAAASEYRTAEMRRLEALERQKTEAIKLHSESKGADIPVAATLVVEAKEDVRKAEAVVPKTIETAAGAARFTTKLVIEVTDPDAVPREFCSPDAVKIRAAANGGSRSIPGVMIREEKRPAFH